MTPCNKKHPSGLVCTHHETADGYHAAAVVHNHKLAIVTWNDHCDWLAFHFSDGKDVEPLLDVVSHRNVRGSSTWVEGQFVGMQLFAPIPQEEQLADEQAQFDAVCCHLRRRRTCTTDLDQAALVLSFVRGWNMNRSGKGFEESMDERRTAIRNTNMANDVRFVDVDWFSSGHCARTNWLARKGEVQNG